HRHARRGVGCSFGVARCGSGRRRRRRVGRGPRGARRLAVRPAGAARSSPVLDRRRSGDRDATAGAVKTEKARPLFVYVLVVAVGAAAFLYPFWLPADRLGVVAHSGDAPLLAAVVGALVVAAMLLEVRRGT